MKRGQGYTGTVGEIINDQAYEETLNTYPHYKINIQQAAKAEPLLDVLHTLDGYFVDSDISSLEPTVIAEMSGDPTYKEIYASGKPHDIYLYAAIKIMPWASEKINAIYNINSPTKESVAAAKKACKTERSMAKPVVLSGAYKAGPRRQWRMLKLMGYDLSLDTVIEMNKAFWGEPMFAKVVEWDKKLQNEVAYNEGFIRNGFGRPFVVLSHKTRDVMNTVAQSTGHHILDIWNYHLSVIVDERKLKAVPVVEDWHDERVWWAPTKEDADALAQAMHDSTARLNEELSPEIPFKADVDICKKFSEFKEPDPWEE